MALLVPNNSMRNSDLRIYGFWRLGILPFIHFRYSIDFDPPQLIESFRFSIRACFINRFLFIMYNFILFTIGSLDLLLIAQGLICFHFLRPVCYFVSMERRALVPLWLLPHFGFWKYLLCRWWRSLCCRLLWWRLRLVFWESEGLADSDLMNPLRRRRIVSYVSEGAAAMFSDKP